MVIRLKQGPRIHGLVEGKDGIYMGVWKPPNVGQPKQAVVVWKYHAVDALCLGNKQSDLAGMFEVGDEGWMADPDDQPVSW